jgi:NADH:ubiquinone oxidoreductase subunit 2 (subunit N)
MGINAVIAAWYYLAVVMRMFFRTSEETRTIEVPYLLKAAMGVATLLLLVAFVIPRPIADMAADAVFLGAG